MNGDASGPTVVATRGWSSPVPFVALAVLTAAELVVAGTHTDPRARTTALAGLLLAKAGILLAYCLRANPRRAAPRLALVAVVLAVGSAVILMLEAAYRARLR